jgi:hypothetical protein
VQPFSKTENRPDRGVTFVVAVNNAELLNANFLASPDIAQSHNCQVILQEKFASAATAYNDAIDKSVHDLMIFCHQDMFFPAGWLEQLKVTLEQLEGLDTNWGVLGCCGITRDGRYRGYVYSSGEGIIGQPSGPVEVQTLDEIVLILRKSSGLRFDKELPHFHLYGTDISMSAARLAMKSYAISVFCIHNTYQSFDLPSEFFQCCRYIRRRCREYLPIQTTCIKITRSGLDLYLRQLKQMYFKYLSRKKREALRVQDVKRLLKMLAVVRSPSPHFRDQSSKPVSALEESIW